MNIRRALLTTIVFVGFAVQAIGQEDNSEKSIVHDQRNLARQVGWDVIDCDTSKWHPKEFHIVYPDLKIIFKLPHEEAGSGVRNLLLINNETGKVHLLDEERPLYVYREYTKFGSEKYDVILLYNNGSYVRYNGLMFEKNVSVEIDMTKQNLQSSDSDSKNWLAMRAFSEPVGDAKRKKKIIPGSGIKVRGYVFREVGESLSWIFTFINSDPPLELLSISEADGYFLIESNNTIQPLHISHGQMCIPFEMTATIDCGIFVVLKANPDLGIIKFGAVSSVKQAQ